MVNIKKLWNVGLIVRTGSVLPIFSIGSVGRSRFISCGEAKNNAILNNMTYKPITLLKKVVAYGLIGYGVVTCWLPSGSQLALLGGCALLGIPFKLVWDKVKLYSKRLWFVIRVLCSIKRVRYELKCFKLSLWQFLKGRLGL